MNASLPILGFAMVLGATAFAQDPPTSAGSAPEAPSDADFEALRKTSPFTRVLSLSETYALRGVARINNQQVATLYNRETKKTLVVTPEGNNEAGISLVNVVGAPQLDGVTAKISFAGDEAELKYETSQLYPEPKGGPGSQNRPPDGERRGPTPQEVERYKALPEEKQAKLREYIGHVMKNYPNMSREERGNLIRGAMMRLTDGGEIQMPPTPPPGQAAPGTPGAAVQGQGAPPATSNQPRTETRGNDNGGGDRRGGDQSGDRGSRDGR